MLFQKLCILKIQDRQFLFEDITLGKQFPDLLDGGIAPFRIVTDILQFPLKCFKLFFQLFIFVADSLVFFIFFPDGSGFRFILFTFRDTFRRLRGFFRLALCGGDAARGKADPVINHALVPVRILLFDLIERIKRLLVKRNGLLIFSGDHLHFAFFKQFKPLAPEIPQIAGNFTPGSSRARSLCRNIGSRQQSRGKNQRKDASVPKCNLLHLSHSFVSARPVSAADWLSFIKIIPVPVLQTPKISPDTPQAHSLRLKTVRMRTTKTHRDVLWNAARR